MTKTLSTLDICENFSRHSELCEESISKSISNVKDSSLTSFPQKNKSLDCFGLSPRNDSLELGMANDFTSPLPMGEGALRAGEGLSSHCEVTKSLSALDVDEDFLRHSEQSEESISKSISNVKDSSLTSFPQKNKSWIASGKALAMTNNGFTFAEFFLPQPTCARKTAFTLAEVLITLGIIGVVAALTIPTLIANKQKMELQTALKKNYSVLSNALIDMSSDLGQTVNPLDYIAQTFVLTYKNYLKVAYYCGTQGCVNMSQDEENPDIKNVIKNYMTYNKSRNVATSIFDDGQIMLIDGSFIIIENPATAPGSERVYITVDVNGYKKKPNVYGHDLFTFQLLNNGKLVPMGSEDTIYKDMNTYCSKNSSDSLNGVGCAYKALTDENYWKNLP